MTVDEALEILKTRRLTIDEMRMLGDKNFAEVIQRSPRNSDISESEGPPQGECLVCSHCGLGPSDPAHPRISCMGHPLIPQSQFADQFVRKPYESPQVKEVGIDRLLTILERNAVTIFRSRLREHFRQSPKTSFGLGDILDGIDKVDP